MKYMISEHFCITLIFYKVMYYLGYYPESSKCDAERKTWLAATCYFVNTNLLFHLSFGNDSQYEVKTGLKCLVRHTGYDTWYL